VRRGDFRTLRRNAPSEGQQPSTAFLLRHSGWHCSPLCWQERAAEILTRMHKFIDDAKKIYKKFLFSSLNLFNDASVSYPS